MAHDKTKHIDVRKGEGQVWKRLHYALADSCPTPGDLQAVVLGLDGVVTDHFGLFTKMPEAIESIITKYNASFEIDKLVLAATEHAPNNGYLIAFALERGIKNTLPEAATELDVHSNGASLETMLDEERGFTNPLHLIQKMQNAVNAVCQICIADKINGTGFLISKDVVLTNYHVLKKVIEASPGYTKDRIKVRFDYQTQVGSDQPTPGNEYSVADTDQWLIDYSEYDPQDTNVKPRQYTLDLTRAEDKLDYAVFRLADSPGDDQVGEPPTKRSWLQIPENGPDYTKVFQATSGVFIFQHPRGTPQDEQKILPLRVDWEKPADISMDKSNVRFVYNVNTRKGSSGSPCFDPLLDLIGLHHSGGKDWPEPSDFLYNQGIPIDKIRELLKSRGKWEQI